MKRQYQISAIVTTDIELDCDRDCKEQVINWFNANLPSNFAFAVHSIKKDRKGSVFLAEYDPEEIFPFVTEEETFREYRVGEISYNVKMNSLRYQTFKKSPTCVVCGLTGDRFILELSGGRKAHFNFYGKGMLITRDHIIPKSLGGPETIENMQTMCTVCNWLKDNNSFTIKQIGELREIYNTIRRGITKNEFRRKFLTAKRKMIAENRLRIPVVMNCDSLLEVV